MNSIGDCYPNNYVKDPPNYPLFFDNVHIHVPNWAIRIWEIYNEHKFEKRFYTKGIPTSNNSEAKQVICMFDERWNSGGLSDRLHGIVSGFYIASKADAEYKINHFSPFDLSLFCNRLN